MNCDHHTNIYSAQGNIVKHTLHDSFAEKFAKGLTKHTQKTKMPMYNDCILSTYPVCNNTLKTDLVSEKIQDVHYFK
jgi:hypothetical protein